MCCIRKDLLKTQHFLGLMLCTASNITARIPLQSAARTSLADSFSPGEAIGAIQHPGEIQFEADSQEKSI